MDIKNKTKSDCVDLQCSDLVTLSSAFIDGDLSPKLLSQIDKHLAECESCRLLISDLKTIVDVAKTLSQPVPEPVRERLRTAIEQEILKQTGNPKFVVLE